MQRDRDHREEDRPRRPQTNGKASNASTAPSRPHGPTGRCSPATKNAPTRLHPGSTATTLSHATKPSADTHPSAGSRHQPDGRGHLVRDSAADGGPRRVRHDDESVGIRGEGSRWPLTGNRLECNPVDAATGPSDTEGPVCHFTADAVSRCTNGKSAGSGANRYSRTESGDQTTGCKLVFDIAFATDSGRTNVLTDPAHPIDVALARVVAPRQRRPLRSSARSEVSPHVSSVVTATEQRARRANRSAPARLVVDHLRV